MAYYLGRHKIIFERPERGQIVRRSKCENDKTNVKSPFTMRSAQQTCAPFPSEFVRAIILIAMNIVHTWHMRHRPARESNDIHGDNPRSRLLMTKGKGACWTIMRCLKP
jgi:hypothetical protein